MSRVGVRSVVYFGEDRLGELEAVRLQDGKFQFPDDEIRIHHISPNSERCHPLAVLQTISYASVRCKLEPSNDASSKDVNEQSPLINLHASCFYELKTAVVLLGTEEIHLVAMPSKQKRFPCFWCYSVPCGLYNPCLWMLNTRCLSIVFDLDETLIVANTMKSFEDRIEVLVGWIARESDPVRESSMTAEMKRYIEDRSLLKQYAETDCVVDGGKVYNVQMEEVPLPFDVNPRIVRPIVRLPEKNIVLTRINPENRDTSVLVRLRPAWEDLKNYLTAKGRKRFEVYVCTMAERDYALEMWRLLDSESNLISSKQLMDRVVCVKSGARKSLLNVFQDGICHPKLAMVIDDRLKVWEDKDQPRVHVVPAFAPYFAPQAESANAVPVLTVARNVACNVRGGFFRDFDENLLHRISDIFYEDETVNLPSAPDVSNYLMSEDANFAPNGYPNAPMPEGINGPEVFQRLNSQEEKNGVEAVSHPLEKNPELKPDSYKLPVGSLPSVSDPVLKGAALTSEKPSLLGNPFRRDSRNLSSTQPPLLPILPLKAPIVQPGGGYLVEESNKRGLGPEIVPESDPNSRLFGNQNATIHGSSSSAIELSHDSQAKNQEATPRYNVQRQSNLPPNTSKEFDVPQNGSSYTNKELRNESDRTNVLPSVAIPVLQQIGRRCRSKVEFRPVISTSNDLQFSVEVFFTGERIGIGMGKTRKDAQQQAAENALRSLAENYTSFIAPQRTASDNDSNLLSDNENGFLWDTVNPGSEEDHKASNGFPKPNT